MILEIQNTLVSMDILTEEFCCDLEACKGMCCIEGDAGAPVNLDEIMELENVLDTVWPDLPASSQAVIDKQGVAYTDREGDLVTSIVNGKDCVFAYNATLPGMSSACCLCATEKAYREGKTKWCKPISCALYPIRIKEIHTSANGGETLYALNYHRWAICKDAVKKGQQLHLPLYKFLKAPLIRRFGEEWYAELCQIADELKKQGL